MKQLSVSGGVKEEGLLGNEIWLSWGPSPLYLHEQLSLVMVLAHHRLNPQAFPKGVVAEICF